MTGIAAVAFSSRGFVLAGLAVAAGLALFSLPFLAAFLPWLAGGAAMLISAMLVVCLLRRWRRFSLTAFLFHLGGLLFIAAGLLSAGREVVTVNVYQGGSVGDIFSGADATVRLNVGEIRRDYYPVSLRIGVRRQGRKYRLLELKSGGEFALPGYRVRVGEFIPWQAAAEITVYDPAGKRVWRGTTPGGGKNLPYEFVLVAYQTPKIRDLAVGLALTGNGDTPAGGIIGPNRVFSWHGYRFFCTGVRRDPYGFPYASIQISRDPGLILFYPAALIVLVAGIVGISPLGRKRMSWRTGKSILDP